MEDELLQAHVLCFREKEVGIRRLMDKLVENKSKLFDALILGQRSKILEAFDKVHLSKL